MSGEWGAAPAGNRPSSSGPAQQKAVGTRECPPSNWVGRKGGWGPPTRIWKSSHRDGSQPEQPRPWAGPPWSASAPGGGSEWSLGERGRRRFGSTPWGGMGSASRPAAEARVQSSAWGRVTTCGSSHRAVCGTGAGGLGRAPLDHCEEGSWRRRPRAAAERGRTDTCWPLVIKAAKLPANTRRLLASPQSFA